MNNDKMRAEFEEWAKPRHYDLTWGNILDNYNILSTRCVWDAWAASRAALVVELPDFFVCGIDAALYRDDVIDALDTAGVAYK